MPIQKSYDHATGICRQAEVSECGKYRWWLRRSWEQGDGRCVCFVMLNPSTADGTVDDPTIRRCIDFVRRWGHSALTVRNLFAYRATDPKVLRTLTKAEAIGGPRARTELAVALTADVLVAAWGRGVPHDRVADAFAIFARKPVWCLGKTDKGSPRHPLYVPKTRALEPFWNCEGRR